MMNAPRLLFHFLQREKSTRRANVSPQTWTAKEKQQISPTIFILQVKKMHDIWNAGKGPQSLHSKPRQVRGSKVGACLRGLTKKKILEPSMLSLIIYTEHDMPFKSNNKRTAVGTGVESWEALTDKSESAVCIKSLTQSLPPSAFDNSSHPARWAGIPSTQAFK